MAAGMLMPMVRFAIDPILEKGSDQDMVAVTDVSKITSEPKTVNWKIKQKDGWYESEVTQSAFVYKDSSGKIVAMSPICKHLGCTVGWNNNPAYPNEFYCPCHGGRYYKNGKNVPGTPPLSGLDLYESKVKNGKLYLGKAVPRGGA